MADAQPENQLDADGYENPGPAYKEQAFLRNGERKWNVDEELADVEAL